ncbi:cellulose binding domain-containing protein [Actinoplanes sp. GCM10030250]|uniref:cellulose binding domain-containing protein n=1 Tax=Actinoplanes sp. GCM10030250 TaxID=3273376 RepID=UPI003614ADE0
MACSVRWAADDWGSGFTANVGVTNLGAARSSWTATFTFPGDQRVTGGWNATVSQSGATVTARNVSWNGGLAAGATVTFGLQATYSGTNAHPTDFRLDGTACSIG